MISFRKNCFNDTSIKKGTIAQQYFDGFRVWNYCGNINQLSIVLILLITCCKPSVNKVSDKQHADNSLTTVEISKDSTSVNKNIVPTISKDSLAKITFLLPSPDEILSEIFSDKFSFNPQLVNPKGNAGKYLESRLLAVNLGVYSADFAYLNLNDNKATALEYFKIVRDLTQKANIYGLFNESIFNRLQNNLTKKDSLNAISHEIYNNMLSILESSRRNNIYALIASGALIESLYLSVSSIENYVDYQPIAQRIFEQKYILQNFYEFASQYDNDKELKKILLQLNGLKTILENSDIKTVEKRTKKIKKGQIEISGGEEIIVSEKSFRILKENVIKIREGIISVSNN